MFDFAPQYHYRRYSYSHQEEFKNRRTKEMDLRRIAELIPYIRVYIKLDKDYEFPKGCNFDELLEAIAYAYPDGDEKKLVLNDDLSDKETVCFNRTRKFLLKRIDQFVYGISQRQADETMASFASLSQLKNIGYVFSGKKRSVPAYSMIILYVIFCLLDIGTPESELCKKYLTLLYNPVHQYCIHNAYEDQLARFCDDCFAVVKNAMEESNVTLTIDSFPAIPRVHPKNDDKAE